MCTDNGEVNEAVENEAGEIKPVGIKPTVGRVVYYKSYGTPGGEYPSVDRAAIITAVVGAKDPKGGEKYMVSLCVLNPEGMFFNQSVEQGQEGGQWDWMPFQKDQASRLAKENKDEVMGKK